MNRICGKIAKIGSLLALLNIAKLDIAGFDS